jgi:hypothetical protein
VPVPQVPYDIVFNLKAPGGMMHAETPDRREQNVDLVLDLWQGDRLLKEGDDPPSVELPIEKGSYRLSVHRYLALEGETTTPSKDSSELFNEVVSRLVPERGIISGRAQMTLRLKLTREKPPLDPEATLGKSIGGDDRIRTGE